MEDAFDTETGFALRADELQRHVRAAIKVLKEAMDLGESDEMAAFVLKDLDDLPGATEFATYVLMQMILTENVRLMKERAVVTSEILGDDWAQEYYHAAVACTKMAKI